MRAHLKGLSARIVMSTEFMGTCVSGLLPNPAKVPYFQYTSWWYSIVQKFYNDGKNIQESQFWVYVLHWPTAMIRPKSQNFKIGHDGILSIGNFILMIKNHILLFQLPGNWPTTKNVLPISVVTRNFLFILFKYELLAHWFFIWNDPFESIRHTNFSFYSADYR
jgi:hypothetical protein